METIHVVYGEPRSEKCFRAHSLAVERLNAFVHEIDNDQDVKLILGSRYRHCIAILDAGDEVDARSMMASYAERVNVELCDVTFEQAPMHA